MSTFSSIPNPASRVSVILQQLDRLPTLPVVAMRVLQMVGTDTASTADVSRLIESDPALTARILQLVHRSDLGVSGQVNSVDRAITLLGFDAVRSAVLAVSVFATFGSSVTSQSPFPRNDFWKHCIAVGCCSELLAQELRANWGKSAGVEPSEAFVAGLLHDIGKMALDASMPKSFARVIETVDMIRGNIGDVERNVIGLDHNVVGKRLAERWQLPANLRDAIWLHGQLPGALPPSVQNARLVNVVTLADMLVREQHLGYSGNYTFPISRAVLLDALGLLPQQIDAAMSGLVDQIESRARALGLGSQDAEDLYRDALQQANKELSRVTDQLSSRNRKLSIRSKYFEALSGFQSELRADAAPAVVMNAIGQTAVGVLETPGVAVFSLPPGAGYAEVILVDQKGNEIQNSLVEMIQPPDMGGYAQVPERPRAGDGPVLAVDTDMEWLVQTFAPRLAGSGLYWICLEADGNCIGGVVWGGQAGEAQRLSTQVQELTALACGWSLALRTCQIRDEARALSEQLADANRRLQSAQSELVRSKMLTTVAEMAAGAAHEMNNPLMIISGRSQLLSATLSDPKQKAHAQLVYEKSQALSNIITELMHFAKPLAPVGERVNVHDLFVSAIEQAKGHTEIADRQIDLNVGEVPDAQVDGLQVGSALAEVVSNAIQATDPATGRITLSASFDTFSNRLVLSVNDNGIGMDEHVLRHAFDPFFSAKAAGRRQGMGLAKALRWIESSGGSMRLESRVGAGCRAIILLPAMSQQPDVAGAPITRAASSGKL